MTKQEIPFWIVATLITLAVVIVGAAVIYGRSLVRLDREKKAAHRRRVEDERRRQMFSPEHRREFAALYSKAQKLRAEVGPIFKDDDTKILEAEAAGDVRRVGVAPPEAAGSIPALGRPPLDAIELLRCASMNCDNVKRLGPKMADFVKTQIDEAIKILADDDTTRILPGREP